MRIEGKYLILEGVEGFLFAISVGIAVVLIYKIIFDVIL